MQRQICCRSDTAKTERGMTTDKIIIAHKKSMKFKFSPKILNLRLDYHDHFLFIYEVVLDSSRVQGTTKPEISSLKEVPLLPPTFSEALGLEDDFDTILYIFHMHLYPARLTSVSAPGTQHFGKVDGKDANALRKVISKQNKELTKLRDILMSMKKLVDSHDVEKHF